MKQQKGMILLMVLLVFSVVAILATAMIDQLAIDTERMSGQYFRKQAHEYALGSEEAVKQGLYLDWEYSPDVDHMGEEWNQDRAFPLNPGAAFIHIEDLQGRFNLNSLMPGANSFVQFQRFQNLLNLLGLNVELAARWRAWLDSNSQSDQLYYSQEPGYRAAYQACRHTSELMLLIDLDLLSYKRLEPYVACLPADTQLNVNTASAFVLAAQDSGLNLAQGMQLVNERGSEGFGSVEDFWQLGTVQNRIKETGSDKQPEEGGQGNNREGGRVTWVMTDFSVHTEYFEVFTRIDLEGYIATLESVIYRSKDNGKMMTLYRDQSRREQRYAKTNTNL